VTEAVARSGWALLSEDRQMGQGVVDGDQAIDELTAEIELAVWDRLREAPPDYEQLQRAVGVLLILPELERSADLAEHIAQRSLTGLGAEMTPTSRGSSSACPKWP
jgi:phosphate transport system protein